MSRLRWTALIALFAFFLVPITAASADPTGTAPDVTGGFPPIIGASVTASPSVTGDDVAWDPCGTYAEGDVGVPTGPTYTLASTDTGTDVCAYELASTTDIVAGWNSVGPVGPGPAVSLAGQPVPEGQTLTVTQVAWGSGATDLTDTWEDCDPTGANCNPVASGATGLSYTVTRSDVGSTIAVIEKATSPSSDDTPGSATTAPTGVVSASAPTDTSPPAVTGTAQVGDTLTASRGTWSNQPTSYAYQWERCSASACTAIPGATSTTYVPVDADVGDTLEVLVTAAVDGTAGFAYPSAPTNPIVGVSTSSPGSSNPGTSRVVPVRTGNAVGRLTATMQWTFRYAPQETQIVALALRGPALNSTIATRCTGHGCPFPIHRIRVRRLKRCRTEPAGHCPVPRSVNLEWEFRGHHLGVGTQVTITVRRPRDIGKYYRFVIRSRRAPSVRISCLAPGSRRPGKDCTGV